MGEEREKERESGRKRERVGERGREWEKESGEIGRKRESEMSKRKRRLYLEFLNPWILKQVLTLAFPSGELMY